MTNTSKPTPEEVERFIRTVYSDTPPDPYASTEEAKKAFHLYLWSDLCMEIFWAYEGADFTWHPDRIEYLEYDLDEERLDELRNGAPLTPEEEARFHERVEFDDYWGAHVYRLAIPPESTEQRAVFFTWIELKVGGMRSEPLAYAGPFREVTEAVRFIYDRQGKAGDWDIVEDFPERPLLEEWLRANG
jgi:hypothetical protein